MQNKCKWCKNVTTLVLSYYQSISNANKRVISSWGYAVWNRWGKNGAAAFFQKWKVQQI